LGCVDMVRAARRARCVECALLVCLAAMCSHPSRGAVTPELQRAVRQGTFEVVLKKPTSDSLKYEKPLPLDLLPFKERTDTYRS